MYGPVLKGTKITLRPPLDSDVAAFVAWFADLEVTRYLGPRRAAYAQFQEEEALKRLGESKTDVLWALESEGRMIGATGIHGIDWLHAHATTGILIGDKTMWGRGIASETMVIRTDYAFRQLNLHKLMSGTFLDNEPSRKALLKAGYRETGIDREHFYREGRWHDSWRCELLRDDWERMQAH